MPSTSCRYCNGTGKITLLTSIVDCECIGSSHIATIEHSGPQTIPEDSHLRNGWYSPTIEKQYGSVVYLDTMGREVTITNITHKPTPFNENIPDQQYVGIVNSQKYVRGMIRLHLTTMVR